MPREGILIDKPYERLSQKQVEVIHQASVEILKDPGLISFNKEAAEIFGSHGAEVTVDSSSEHPCWLVKVPERLVVDALEKSQDR